MATIIAFTPVFSSGTTLGAFAGPLIDRLAAAGRVRTAETYSGSLLSFRRFAGGDVPLSRITAPLMEEYEMYLESKGLRRNTVSFYMRTLRAVYNRAVETGSVSDATPFRGVYTGVERTLKRGLDPRTVARIAAAPLSDAPALAYARDLFLLSFYLRGMAFVDLAFLRKDDLRDGVLTYARRKTGQRLHIRWEPCMAALAARRAAVPESPYLLGIIRRPGANERNQYLSASRRVNASLHELGRRLRLAAPLTMYVARHSWASIARASHVPLPLISAAMGHDNEATTRIYLATLDGAALDRANRRIIREVAGILG